MPIIPYFVAIKPGKIVLWCYLIWYLVTIYHHFDPSLKIWINSAGISAVIGCGLLLSVNGSTADAWQTFRLFLMPFCVSSFSSLIKGQGFIFVFSSNLSELFTAIGCCSLFSLSVVFIKSRYKKPIRGRYS